MNSIINTQVVSTYGYIPFQNKVIETQNNDNIGEKSMILKNYWMIETNTKFIETTIQKKNLYFFCCFHSTFENSKNAEIEKNNNSLSDYISYPFNAQSQKICPLVSFQNVIIKKDAFVSIKLESKNSVSFNKIPPFIKSEIENGANVFVYDHEKNKNFIDTIKPGKISSENNIISGTLCLSGKMIYGKNGKGMMKYKFIPYLREYPNYVVASRFKLDESDKYVRVQINEWEKHQTNPTASLVSSFGNVHDTKIYMDFLSSTYNLFPKERKKCFRDKLLSLQETTDKINFTKKNFYDISHLPTLSIDPKGCIDIDDAFSICEKSLRIYVNIATPTLHFVKNSTIDKIANRQTSSIYFDSETHHLLPDLIVDASSLLEKKQRYCISIEFSPLSQNVDYAIDIGNNVQARIVKTKIINDYNESYESVYKCPIVSLFDNVNERLFGLNTINNYFEIENTNNVDYHKIVEFYMIKSNEFVAKFLIQNNTQSIILRKTFTNLQNSNSKAWYSTFSNNNNNKHKTLNIDEYTHFTSPIRRYVDQIVHRQLLNILNTEENNLYFINTLQINSQSTQIATAYSEMVLFQKIILNCNENKELSINGNFQDFIHNSNCPNILMKMLESNFELKNDKNCILSIPLYSQKLNELFDVKFVNEELTITCISFKDDVVKEHKSTFSWNICNNSLIKVKIHWNKKKGLEGILYEWVNPPITNWIQNLY
jgi:hypothetical protein